MSETNVIIVQEVVQVVTLESENYTETVNITQNTVQVVTVADQGPPGIQGPPGPEGPPGPIVVASDDTLGGIRSSSSVLVDSEGVATVTPHSIGSLSAQEIIMLHSTYIHTQLTPSEEWIIQHNKNKYPAVAVVDSAGTLVEGDVEYTSLDEVRLTFNGGFAGKAYLN